MRDITCLVSPFQDGNLIKPGKGWNKHYKKPAEMNIPIQRTILLYGGDEN